MLRDGNTENVVIPSALNATDTTSARFCETGPSNCRCQSGHRMPNQKLRERDTMNTDAIATLSDKLTLAMQEIEIIEPTITNIYET